MPDIIRLLPDSVANQIAAGEVIQRPASAVKELLENAVDAGSTDIQLIVKDSGKTLILIIDNGCGMSETDARMSFERHATSKIRSADDLFSIRTMGFRGEALASIAAIAQVELKTRRHNEDIGTCIEIEGAEVKMQQPVSITPGTSISIKNLFYNVPARRNFLKSNTVEARHVIEEFERVALAHPAVAMSLSQNGLEVFKLTAVANDRPGIRQRIVNLFGSNYNERLVPVHEETTLLNISGFTGKPEFAKKSRGEQYFFVNGRFIKDPYLHHAVQNAFEELLPRDSFPSYWLYIDINPSKIDINIHPTKTEIKFEDERSIYSIVRAAVKRSLGQYSVAPALDFEQEQSFTVPYAMRNEPVQQPAIKVNPDYNPFRTDTKKISAAGWEKLYEPVKNETKEIEFLLNGNHPLTPAAPREETAEPEAAPFQVNRQFIVRQEKSGLMLVDQQRAHERILFEKYLRQIRQRSGPSQQSLFPSPIELSPADFMLMQELQEDLRTLGFDLREFGANTFVLHGASPDVEAGKEKEVLESLLEQLRNNHLPESVTHHEKLARSMAKSMAIRPGAELTVQQMKNLLAELSGCEKPALGADGKRAAVLLSQEEIRRMFVR